MADILVKGVNTAAGTAKIDYASLANLPTNATESKSGFMSASDKVKLNGIATGANKTVVDTALSTTSTNPVQNKVVAAAVDGKAPTSHAIAETIYGAGTGSNYGHVKLSDSTSSSSAASSGIAASPKAVKSAYDLANTAKTNAATAQSTADAAKTAAANAQSTADAAIPKANFSWDSSTATLNITL